MITRKEYVRNGSELHRAYFAQFVTDATRTLVRRRIGAGALRNSTDKHMNDISMPLWDGIIFYPFGGKGVKVSGRDVDTLCRAPGSMKGMRRFVNTDAMKEAGEGWTNAVLTCILKEAGRQVKEGH